MHGGVNGVVKVVEELPTTAIWSECKSQTPFDGCSLILAACTVIKCVPKTAQVYLGGFSCEG